MKKIITIFSLAYLAGCTATATDHRPESYYFEQSPMETTDLFNNESGLSDQEIEDILNYRLKLPSQNRIAILKLTNQYNSYHYSGDLTVLSESLAENFIAVLESSDRIYDASFLPELLIPKQRTAPFLRKAAARFQADLLLVYRSDCRNYQKYRLFKPNESKSYCSVEAALLDIRKGIIPFTALATKDFKTPETKSDMNFYETRMKAELEATSKSLSEIANLLVKYLHEVEEI